MKRGRNQRRRQGGNINRALDSNGPDVRIRGTANQIYDKYQALARDASSSGDRVKAENYLQHAEHYFRLIRSLQPVQSPPPEFVDVDGEQPSIGEETRPRRDNGGPEDASASSDDEEDESDTAVASEAEHPNGASAPAGGESEQRRPRRRRPRRQSQGEGAANETREEKETAEVVGN